MVANELTQSMADVLMGKFGDSLLHLQTRNFGNVKTNPPIRDFWLASEVGEGLVLHYAFVVNWSPCCKVRCAVALAVSAKIR